MIDMLAILQAKAAQYVHLLGPVLILLSTSAPLVMSAPTWAASSDLEAAGSSEKRVQHPSQTMFVGLLYKPKGSSTHENFHVVHD